jgi:hypothetical protein
VLKRKEHVEDLGIDGKVILKWILVDLIMMKKLRTEKRDALL